jgi:hypothetical protein
MLLLELDQVLLVLALLLPRWLALHLLGAWHLLLACPAPPWCLACFLLQLDLVSVTMITKLWLLVWFGGDNSP